MLTGLELFFLMSPISKSSDLYIAENYLWKFNKYILGFERENRKRRQTGKKIQKEDEIMCKFFGVVGRVARPAEKPTNLVRLKLMTIPFADIFSTEMSIHIGQAGFVAPWYS